MKAPKNILVRSPNWIGDQILAYPFFHFLRESFPSSRITVACVPWVQSIQFQNLVDEVLVLPTPLKSTFRGRWDAVENGAQLLRSVGQWDLGITLPNSFSAAWMLYRAQVKVRRGYNTEGRRFLLTEAVHAETDLIRHRSEAYVRLLPDDVVPKKPIREFWGVPSLNDLDLGIPGVLDQFDADKAWPDAEALDPLEGPYWVLAPGSTAESRRWPVERFGILAREIAEETGWTGIIVGGPSETSLAQRLSEDKSLRLLDWTAKGTVASYWKVFRNAKFSVCNDSGLAHVASLCGSLVQIVWGAGNPKRTEPLGPGKVQISLNPVECWPCERNSCVQPLGKQFECLKGIYSDVVWKEIKSGIKL